MTQYDYDLLVIGAGSGGVRASRMSASYGAKVAVIEDTFLGGTCVNVGCVPKKLFVYGSHIAEDIEMGKSFGWSTDNVEFDWATLRDNKTREIERLNGVYQNILTGAGVEIIHGRGVLKGPHEVAVGDKIYTAERILLATGGKPVVPDIPGAEHIITSDDAFYLESFPESVLVLGGGYIAVEFAGIFNGLGAETRLLYRGPLFLRGFDSEVRQVVADELAKKGVDVSFNINIESVEKLASGKLKVSLTNGTTTTVDCVMSAIGRRPRFEALGLDEVGVKLDANGKIAVDDQFQSSLPSIYAIGDIIDGPELTPVALAEGMVLARNLYGGQSLTVDYNDIATAVFCQPNIGTVGLTEDQVQESGRPANVFTTQFRHMKHSLGDIQEKTFMKLLIDAETDRVLGAHMVGSDAGEVIQGIAVAMKAGATKADFDATIGIHPTAAEEFVTMRESTRKLNQG